jgi:hypothetical protein
VRQGHGQLVVQADDRVIIDAGANVAMFTVYAAWQTASATIAAIERPSNDSRRP